MRRGTALLAAALVACLAHEVRSMPHASSLKPHERFTEDCQDDLAVARELLARAKAGPTRTVATTLELYNELLIHLGGARNRSELIAEVHPDADMRNAA